MESENSEQKSASEKMLYLLQKEILTFEEACLYLGRSSSSMYKLTSGRLIPYYVPTGKLIYFRKSELDTWILKNKRKSKDEIYRDVDIFLTNRRIKEQKIRVLKQPFSKMAVLLYENFYSINKNNYCGKLNNTGIYLVQILVQKK